MTPSVLSAYVTTTAPTDRTNSRDSCFKSILHSVEKKRHLLIKFLNISSNSSMLSAKQWRQSTGVLVIIYLIIYGACRSQFAGG